MGQKDEKTQDLAAAQDTTQNLAVTQPDWIGPYKILERIGKGGMGFVYLAEQREPVRRRVAIKVIRWQHNSKEFLARFDAERHALERMSHDGIATILDAGSTEDGQPYLVMEHVQGLAITDYCDQKRMAIPERLALFRKVCDAVQHAHQKGVIHRDLKPSNILVHEATGGPVPKIIDFGVARATSAPLTEKTLHTEQGRILGTPAYMSPEQAGLSALDIDTRTDIYALGVILYQLLVGELPISLEELAEAGYLEVQRKIREDTPPKPSTRITTTSDSGSKNADLRQLAPRNLCRYLAGDLDWITMKAIEKERDRRYPTATALSEDIACYLNNMPVSAGPPSASYLFKKWARRHRGAVAAYASITLTLLVGLIVSMRLYREVSAQSSQLQFVHEPLLLAAYEREAAELWPPWPEKLAAMSGWITKAEVLLARLPEYQAALRIHPDGMGDDLPLSAEAISAHINGLLDLGDDSKGTLARVKERRSWARSIMNRSILGHQQTWKDRIAAIAKSDFYDGFELKPQLGLVPLGPDPRSGLEEFVHLYSAARGDSAVPQRNEADGSLKIDQDMGLVFVLIPGGEFDMGAQSVDKTRSNYDPLALDTEGPVKSVRLEPFFLSKYEVNQAQWQRIAAYNPSNNKQLLPDGAGLLYPVEDISWEDSVRYLGRMNFKLPTEAQWEFACRALNSSPWSFGEEQSDLPVYVNFADRFASEAGAGWPGIDTRFNDGYAVTAPIGSFEPNDFGLHDMHGNVWEWCRDGYTEYLNPDTTGTEGEAVGGRVYYRPMRGGHFRSSFTQTRSSSRFAIRRENRSLYYGVRAMRPVYR